MIFHILWGLKWPGLYHTNYSKGCWKSFMVSDRLTNYRKMFEQVWFVTKWRVWGAETWLMGRDVYFLSTPYGTMHWSCSSSQITKWLTFPYHLLTTPSAYGHRHYKQTLAGKSQAFVLWLRPWLNKHPLIIGKIHAQLQHTGKYVIRCEQNGWTIRRSNWIHNFSIHILKDNTENTYCMSLVVIHRMWLNLI